MIALCQQGRKVAEAYKLTPLTENVSTGQASD